MEQKKVKIHLGCGYNHIEGYINVDLDPRNRPDKVMDLDKAWDFADNSVDHIRIHFVLEHIEYKHFFKEAYRVLKKGGTADIKVPCGLDFTSFQDPTHIHFYMPNSIQHLTDYQHPHYNTNEKDWDFKHIKTTLLFRNWLHRPLYWMFRIIRLDNIAYLFVWGVQWLIEKK